MDIVCERCAGIDVHKRTVVVCRLTRDAQGARLAETQTFGTTTGELLHFCDWLAEGGCMHVGLESTGEFWKPVFNLLEGTCAVWLLNAAHITAVPGRKTDGKDAQWIAELLAHGLWPMAWCVPASSRPVRSASCAT
jgi:transposase